MLRMQGSAVTRTLESLPGLAGVLQLKTGGAYATDSLSLAMALLAGPSAAGEWSAVVGVPDFGLEAAAAYGLDLDRTVVVPRPGEHWLSVTAGLLEVAGVVLVQPVRGGQRAPGRAAAVPAAAEGRGPGLPGRLAPSRRHAPGHPLDLVRAGPGPRPPVARQVEVRGHAPAPRRARCRSGCRPRTSACWPSRSRRSSRPCGRWGSRRSNARGIGAMATTLSDSRRATTTRTLRERTDQTKG